MNHWVGDIMNNKNKNNINEKGETEEIDIEPIDKCQIKSELIAADIRSTFAPVGVLTNLVDKYFFYWIDLRGDQFHLFELFVGDRRMAYFIVNLIMNHWVGDIMNNKNKNNINESSFSSSSSSSSSQFPFLSRTKLRSRITFVEPEEGIAEEDEKDGEERDYEDEDEDEDSEEEEKENEKEKKGDEKKYMDTEEEKRKDNGNSPKKSKSKTNSNRLKYLKTSSSRKQCGWRIPTKSGKYLMAVMKGPNEAGGVELTWDEEEKNYYYNQLGKVLYSGLQTPAY